MVGRRRKRLENKLKLLKSPTNFKIDILIKLIPVFELHAVKKFHFQKILPLLIIQTRDSGEHFLTYGGA